MAFPQNILEFLNGAQGPQEAPDTVQGILTNRWQPTAQDVGNAALAGISNDSYVNPQQYSDNRMTAAMKQMMVIEQMQKMQSDNLPQGYRLSPKTGQAELIPGVDPSFGKKADPYAMPMPVILPNGQPGFAPKKDVINNPSGFQPIPTEGQGNFKRENTVRDEFNTLTKDFRTVQDAYSKIQKTSDSGAGDMSMLYAYVKLLDPGSVVRESEFATAAAAGSYGERVQGAVKGIISGGRLPPSLRKEFMSEAGRIYQGQKVGYDRTKQTYTDIASRYGLDPKNVITDYGQATIQPPTPEEEAEYRRLKGMQ